MCRAGEKGSGMNWRTHDVFNQFSELSDYDLFTTDRALTEALGRCANWSSEQLTTFGASLGSAETYALADNANRHKPELQTSMRAVGVSISSTSIRLGIRCLEFTGSRVWCRYRSASRGRDDGPPGRPDSTCTHQQSAHQGDALPPDADFEFLGSFRGWAECFNPVITRITTAPSK
jgi:hypothetical protein